MGVLDRLILEGEQWERMSRHIIGDERTRGSSGRDNRMFVEAVLWIVRTGSPGTASPCLPPADRCVMARPAGRVRLVEQRVSPVQPMKHKGHLAPHLHRDGR